MGHGVCGLGQGQASEAGSRRAVACPVVPVVGRGREWRRVLRGCCPRMVGGPGSLFPPCSLLVRMRIERGVEWDSGVYSMRAGTTFCWNRK